MCRHVIKGKSYRIRVVRRHNTIVIVAIRMCRRVIEGKSYRIRVVRRHNSIVIVAIQMCRLAGKEKTIVGGVVAGVAGGEAGVGLRCANRDLRGGGGGWGEPCATSAGDGRRPYSRFTPRAQAAPCLSRLSTRAGSIPLSRLPSAVPEPGWAFRAPARTFPGGSRCRRWRRGGSLGCR